MPRLLALIAAILVTLSASGRTVNAQAFSPKIDSEYFWDGGAVPFLCGSAALAI